MKNRGILINSLWSVIVPLFIISLFGCTVFLKINPVADADKSPFPPQATDMTCWMATASNMLAGSGYGTGTTVQQRSDDIYADMVTQYGTLNRGWPQTALQWWLNSANNTNSGNPYRLVTFHGNTSMYPWNRSDLPQFMANELRKCHFLGLVFSWPTNELHPDGSPMIGRGGHATTPWGDHLTREQVTVNPFSIIMSDSDREDGGDRQTYFYDSYQNPNPGGPNEGSGCYFNYSSNHPYIRGVVTLEPVDDITDNWQTQIVVGSYKIHQGKRVNAIDLHYTVGTDVQILSYRTTIDWDPFLTPSITESQPVRNSIKVDWDLKSKPVRWCSFVTITTEFVEPNWNGIYYRDVHFTYPEGPWIYIPDIEWRLETPLVRDADKLKNVVGGYVIGSFEVVNSINDSTVNNVYEYRFIHQYSYNQDPEKHILQIMPARGLVIQNLKLGHSYGKPAPEDLWKFENWMTRESRQIEITDRALEYRIDWTGKLPYPEGIDVTDAIKDINEKIPQKPSLRTYKYRVIR